MRWVDTELSRPRWRTTATYRVLPAFQVGAEYNLVANELSPLATLFLLTEGDRRPALFLGTSSDRIGSPEGMQAYYATMAKYFPPLRASAYVTANYSEWDERINVPFGANVELGGGFSLQPMYDGNRSHLLLNYSSERYAVSLIAAWMEQAGVAVSFGF